MRMSLITRRMAISLALATTASLLAPLAHAQAQLVAPDALIRCYDCYRLSKPESARSVTIYSLGCPGPKDGPT